MEHVLAHCRELDAYSAGPRYAAAVASVLKVPLAGVYVSPGAPRLPANAPWSLTREFLDYVHEQMEQARRSQTTFATWARRCGVHATHWQTASGRADDAIARASNWTDLLVLEHRRRVPHEWSLLGKAVSSGVPCIVVPESPNPPAPGWARIAVAWNGSAESIRALHSALPLLRLAEEIHLLSLDCDEGRVAGAPRQPVFSVEHYLEDHGLRVKSTTRGAGGPSTGAALLIAAANVAADLLVMGAFGTTRLQREPAGITHDVLNGSSTLPVFLRH